jgi:anhydro-N-acetylmuramic acid kinase
MGENYLGLMSGTSTDGVDAVLAEIDEQRCLILEARTFAYPDDIAIRLRRLIETPRTSLRDLGSLDRAVGSFFARCSLELIHEAGREPTDVAAIGHHGQTIYHQPHGAEPFSMQIGDPSIIAATTGITTVADFRRPDMAHGGHGAPLTPAFHAWRFRTADAVRAVVNIGGIANVTMLVPGRPVIGFDTGPGNTLLDIWTQLCLGKSFDHEGRWAASGRVETALLERFVSEPFFATPAPKSTGRELFNRAWLEKQLAQCPP